MSKEKEQQGAAPAIEEVVEVKAPTCGRIVHFFPNGADAHCAENFAEKVPAIVVQEFGGLMANLSVFPMNLAGTNVLRYSVEHKSKAQEGQSYWDWPEVK